MGIPCTLNMCTQNISYVHVKIYYPIFDSYLIIKIVKLRPVFSSTSPT